MSMRYDGIEFDTVEELIEYRNAVDGKSAPKSKPVGRPRKPVGRPVGRPRKTKAPSVMIEEGLPRKRRNKSTHKKNKKKFQKSGKGWTEEEKAKLMELFNALKKENGRLPWGSVKNFANILGRTPGSIHQQLAELKK